MKFPDEPYELVNTAHKRLRWTGAALASLFLGLGVRLSWVSLAPMPGAEPLSLAPLRAEILDRQGRTLASTVTTFSVYAHPERITHKQEAIASLRKIFPELSQEMLEKTLFAKKSFAWVVRHVTPEKKMAVQALGIEGIEIQRDSKRIYPHGALLCHTVGMTDIDQQGISGLEKSFHDQLSAQGRPLQTSLDLSLQHLVYHALSAQIKEFQAEAGNAVLADIHTGEILAMVSFPDFTPSEGGDHGKALFNRNLSGVYEFGSIMKVHNVALLLESGRGSLNSVFDASRPLRIGRFQVTDFRGKNRPLTVEESFLYSSNIANAKMAQAVGGKLQMDFFKKLGLTRPLKVELPESARPLIPSKWSEPCVLTAGYGYGFAVTPLHIVQSISTIVSGHYTPLTLLKKKERALCGRNLISQATAKTVAHLMAKAALQGQAQKASPTNCRVGAKTGTANLRLSGRYCQKENLTSCVSIFPADKPRYILLVSVERAKPNAKTHYFATAGWIAAPVASQIVEQVAPLLDTLYKAPSEGAAALVERTTFKKKF